MGERLMALMMDEFMFLNSNSYPTILPLLVNGAALLLTSSMSASADNEIKRMIMAKLPDGRELVQRLDWIRACHTCTANGTHARVAGRSLKRLVSFSQARRRGARTLCSARSTFSARSIASASWRS